VPILGNTISTLTRTQGIGDLYRIYLGAQRNGMDYNLSFIPSDFEEKPKEAFDPEYMSKLFDLGYRMAKNGYPWEKAPRDLNHLNKIVDCRFKSTFFIFRVFKT
jgi:hypothetical protein